MRGGGEVFEPSMGEGLLDRKSRLQSTGTASKSSGVGN
jgi:hypothetical protein